MLRAERRGEEESGGTHLCAECAPRVLIGEAGGAAAATWSARILERLLKRPSRLRTTEATGTRTTWWTTCTAVEARLAVRRTGVLLLASRPLWTRSC